MAPPATLVIFTRVTVFLAFSSMMLLQSEARPYYISTSLNSVRDFQHLKPISPPSSLRHSWRRKSPVPPTSPPAWFYFYSPPPPSPPHSPKRLPRFAHPPPPPGWFYFYSPPPPNPPHSPKHRHPRFGHCPPPQPPRSV